MGQRRISNLKKKNGGSIWFFVGVLILILLASFLFDSGTSQEKLTYSTVLTHFREGMVNDFVIEGNNLSYTLKEDPDHPVKNKNELKKEFKLYSVELFIFDAGDTIAEQFENKTIEKYDIMPEAGIPWWQSILPYVIILVIMGGIFYVMFNQMGGAGTGKAASFTKARTKTNADDKNRVTFDDVAGAEEEKEELAEIVEFLKNPQKFTELGARIPKGIILVGPPGNGKTLFARAVAGEARVPFFSITGSDFVELYVGVGASRVRDLFDQAKKVAPSIIFIDEIDAVGRQRGAGLGGGHDEREQTLNQLLVEMDGFSKNEGVIIIAATNRPDVLDPALLRPGRFDRQIVINLPDVKGREGILKLHARNKKLDDDVKLDIIAKTTAGFSGADLENVLNEAALLAARNGKHSISMEDIERSIIKVMMGVEKKNKVISDKERKLTAYHEAGHALVTIDMPDHDKVHEISIIPRGMAGGYTLHLPPEDKFYMSKGEMQDRMVILLGGRVAEQISLDDISTGASNDLERATNIARQMVTKYGMSDRLGPVVFGSGQDEVFLGRDFAVSRNYSEQIAAAIDEEIRNFIDKAAARAKEILERRRTVLDKVAQALLEKEKISGEEFEAICNEG